MRKKLTKDDEGRRGGKPKDDEGCLKLQFFSLENCSFFFLAIAVPFIATLERSVFFCAANPLPSVSFEAAHSAQARPIL